MVSLLQAFQGRIRKIMDSSQNAFHEDTTKLTEKLDETERCLFKAGQCGLNDFQRWETRRTEKLNDIRNGEKSQKTEKGSR